MTYRYLVLTCHTSIAVREKQTEPHVQLRRVGGPFDTAQEAEAFIEKLEPRRRRNDELFTILPVLQPERVR